MGQPLLKRTYRTLFEAIVLLFLHTFLGILNILRYDKSHYKKIL